jgi:hypothetical protein
MFHDIFFLNRTVYEKMWKNIAEPDRPQAHAHRTLDT